VRTLIPRSFTLLFLIFLLSSLATNLVTPIWSIYIKSLGASMAELGYVFATSNAIAATLQIISGLISDKYGRRKLHVLGTFLAIFPPSLYTLAMKWTDLIPWVILAGASTGLYTPIRWSMVSDVSTVGNRARAYSRINIAYYAGFIIGPLLGGLIADIYNVRAPFSLCFLLMGLSFPLSLFLQETRMERSVRGVRKDENAEAAAFPKVISLLSLFYLTEGIGLGIFDPITPVLVVTRFSVDLTYVGILYTVGYGVTSFLLQIPGGWMADKYDKKKITIITYFLASPFFALFAMSRNVWEPFIFMALSVGLISLPWSAHQSLRMNLTPPSRWGLVSAISYTMYWAGMMTGSLLSGFLWDNFGMLIPYYVSSATIFVAVIPIFFLGNAHTPSSRRV